VSLASIRLLCSRPWRDDVERIERMLARGLEQLCERTAVADVRVLGAIGVVEMHEPLVLRDAQRIALDRGVWLRPFGRLLYTMPPFISTDLEVAEICSAMAAVVDRVSAA
jgi:adenosylmethionine-8-amino-7-oxononanoate aminotransferase